MRLCRGAGCAPCTPVLDVRSVSCLVLPVTSLTLTLPNVGAVSRYSYTPPPFFVIFFEFGLNVTFCLVYLYNLHVTRSTHTKRRNNSEKILRCEFENLQRGSGSCVEDSPISRGHPVVLFLQRRGWLKRSVFEITDVLPCLGHGASTKFQIGSISKSPLQFFLKLRVVRRGVPLSVASFRPESSVSTLYGISSPSLSSQTFSWYVCPGVPSASWCQVWSGSNGQAATIQEHTLCVIFLVELFTLVFLHLSPMGVAPGRLEKA